LPFCFIKPLLAIAHLPLLPIAGLQGFADKLTFGLTLTTSKIIYANMSLTKKLSAVQQSNLLQTLEMRFANNPQRHKGLLWASVLAKLQAAPKKIMVAKQNGKLGRRT